MQDHEKAHNKAYIYWIVKIRHCVLEITHSDRAALIVMYVTMYVYGQNKLKADKMHHSPTTLRTKEMKTDCL